MIFKKLHSLINRLTPGRLILGMGITLLCTHSIRATPYATCLTNNGDGTVSFRLNQTTGTNDLVHVIVGTVTNILQVPSADPANFIARGLIVTNIGIAPSTVFKVRIKHVGSGTISTNSPSVSFGSPRGVAVNLNPASPYFGWVYVANSATNANNKGDGMFAFTSDLTDILGQGLVPKSGGYNFGTGGASAPYHCSVTPDDSVLVTDFSDASGNLISMPPLLSSFTYALKQATAPGIGVLPVNSNNIHGSIISAFITGTGASRKLYTMDEDYQRNPASSTVLERNSAWEYDIGAASFPWLNAPDRKLMTPYLQNFDGQNQKCEVYGHYLYTNQRRSNPPQHDTYITDLNNLEDPSSWDGSTTPWDVVWTSQGESLAEGYSDDVLRDTMTTSVSPDAKYYAAIIAAGSGTAITAPDGSTFNTLANDVVVIPLTNGIPNLPARQVFSFGGAGNGRDLAFDAAHNIYCVSSGLGLLQSLDLGESTDCLSGSDGTFVFGTPSTQVSVVATTPIAYEQGVVPGVFTLTRTPDDIGAPVKVFYSITGTAKGGTNYVAITNNVTIAAGQTSTNILVTPIADGKPDSTLTVVLSVLGAGGYSVGFPLSATVVIADNSTPQLQIASFSTNIFQGTTNDYAALTLQRFGDTNVSVVLDATNFTFGGTAISNVDYYLANLPFTMAPGVATATFPLIYPKQTSTAVGKLSIVLTNLAGPNFTVTNNTAATTLTLEAVPPGTVLFSDNFEVDSSANWDLKWATYTNAPQDYTVQFAYNYAAGDGAKNLPAFPPAPHSTSGDTHGLYMTVNKGDDTGVSSAVNLYLKNAIFSNNFALRFDMLLIRNTSTPQQSRVENALFGINFDGSHTNWFRNSVFGTSLLGAPTLSDGLMFDIGADGSGGAGAPYDFSAWSGPTWTNSVQVIGPTNFLSRLATSTTQLFKRPPYDAGNTAGGVPAGGAPANTVLSATPTWAEVEVSQVQTVNGNLITWKVNNSIILSFLNTNSAAGPGSAYSYTNGTIMLGYDDPWDDIGNGGANAGEGSVIYDNVRVVSIAPPLIVTQPQAIVALPGTATNLSVLASTSTGVTNYQWQHAGTNIAGATNTTLNLPSLAFADWGSYTAVVDDGAYTVYSSNAYVLPPVGAILTQPVSRAALQGATLNPAFSVVAQTHSLQTNYQWYSNSVAVAGQTNSSLALGNIQAGSFTPNTFYVTVNDGANSLSLTSSVVSLTHPVAPSVTQSVSGNTLSMTFPSEFGPSYVTEYKTNLNDPTWKPLVTNVGTGNPITVTDALPTPNVPSRFYRTRLQ